MLTEVRALKRSMKTFGSLLIILSVITPASSVFIIVPGVIQQAGTGAFLSFILAAIAGIFMAFIYAELASAYPYTGGEYTIVGRTLGPLPGFIVLGVNILTFILILAAMSLGMTSYLQPIFPNASPVLVAILSLVVVTFFGILKIKTNAVITGSFLALEILALIVLMGLGFSHVSRPLSDFLFSPVYLDATSQSLQSTPFSLIGLATATAIWAYNGYGNAVYLGEETHEAPKRVVRVIFLAFIITIITETVPMTAVMLGAPDLKNLMASTQMFNDFILARGGEKLSIIVSLSIALAVLNANIAIILMTARQIFSTARDQTWMPFINRALTRIHSRFHSPWIATLLAGFLSALACLIDIHTLFIIIGSSLVFIYASLCAAAIAGRTKGLTAQSYYRMPLYPLPPVLALLAMGYIIYADYLDEAVGRPSLWATAAMIALSAIYYFAILRRRGSWTMYSPKDNNC